MNSFFVKARSKSKGASRSLPAWGLSTMKLLRWALQCQMLWSLKNPQFMPFYISSLLI